MEEISSETGQDKFHFLVMLNFQSIYMLEAKSGKACWIRPMGHLFQHSVSHSGLLADSGKLTSRREGMLASQPIAQS